MKESSIKTKRQKLLDLLHHADVTLSYWDGKRSGAVERELTTTERMLLIGALRGGVSLPRAAQDGKK